MPNTEGIRVPAKSKKMITYLIIGIVLLLMILVAWVLPDVIRDQNKIAEIDRIIEQKRKNKIK